MRALRGVRHAYRPAFWARARMTAMLLAFVLDVVFGTLRRLGLVMCGVNEHVTVLRTRPVIPEVAARQLQQDWQQHVPEFGTLGRSQLWCSKLRGLLGSVVSARLARRTSGRQTGITKGWRIMPTSGSIGSRIVRLLHCELYSKNEKTCAPHTPALGRGIPA